MGGKFTVARNVLKLLNQRSRDLLFLKPICEVITVKTNNASFRQLSNLPHAITYTNFQREKMQKIYFWIVNFEIE